jgi:hypothetical protein
MITDDLVRTIAYFLPNTHLTPSGIWHLASVCSTSRKALKDWLLEYKKIVMQARQLCAKVGGTSGGVAASQVLDWQQQKIDEADMTTLANISQSGALASLKVLDLDENQIGNAGISALAKAIGKGALPVCNVIGVVENPGNAASLKAACEERGIMRLS